MFYKKPELKIERIATALKSSPGGSLGDSQAGLHVPIINATLS